MFSKGVAVMIGLPALSGATGRQASGPRMALSAVASPTFSCPLPRSPASSLLMKAWTTPEQLLFLESQIPDWHQSRRIDRITPFVVETFTKFCVKFPVPPSEEEAVREVSWFPCLPFKSPLTMATENQEMVLQPCEAAPANQETTRRSHDRELDKVSTEGCASPACSGLLRPLLHARLPPPLRAA